jgi:hypothetical protein
MDKYVIIRVPRAHPRSLSAPPPQTESWAQPIPENFIGKHFHPSLSLCLSLISNLVSLGRLFLSILVTVSLIFNFVSLCRSSQTAWFCFISNFLFFVSLITFLWLGLAHLNLVSLSLISNLLSLCRLFLSLCLCSARLYPRISVSHFYSRVSVSLISNYSVSVLLISNRATLYHCVSVLYISIPVSLSRSSLNMFLSIARNTVSLCCSSQTMCLCVAQFYLCVSAFISNPVPLCH